MSLNLKPSHLMTVGACIFAGYALYETFKAPGSAASTQPGQAQRDAALTSFNNLTMAQAADIAGIQTSTTPNF